MKKVSIIVPIYNVEAYVRACFESLLTQDFNDYQIVAVNDGSIANEQVIIDEYALKYPDKFIGVKKENGGYGSVLQYAIDTIDTPYFIVCDPDDTLQPNALSTLVRLMETHDADIVVGCKSYVYHQSNAKDYHPVINQDYFKLDDLAIGIQGKESIEPFYFMDPSPHAKLYKTAIAKGCKFPTKVAYTDNLLYFYNLCKSNKVVYTSESLANYLIDRPNNSMSDVKPKAIDANGLVFETIVNQVSNQGYGNPIFYYRLYESFKWLISQINATSQSYEDKLNQAKNSYHYFELMAPYKEKIKDMYKKYSHTSFLQKYRDFQILKGNQNAYNTWVNKIIVK